MKKNFTKTLHMNQMLTKEYSIEKQNKNASNSAGDDETTVEHLYAFLVW